MLQAETILNIADNSGGLKALILPHAKSSQASRAKKIQGNIVMLSIKKNVRNGSIKKGEKFLGVIVRCKKSLPNKYANISNISYFSDNAAVLLNEKYEMIGTRVFGPIPSFLRFDSRFLKILSLAKEVV